MKIPVLFAAITLIGTISAAFLLALLKTFQPQQLGFFHRLVSFSFGYCWPAGVAAAVMFTVLYWKVLKQ